MFYGALYFSRPYTTGTEFQNSTDTGRVLRYSSTVPEFLPRCNEIWKRIGVYPEYRHPISGSDWWRISIEPRSTTFTENPTLCRNSVDKTAINHRSKHSLYSLSKTVATVHRTRLHKQTNKMHFFSMYSKTFLQLYVFRTTISFIIRSP